MVLFVNGLPVGVIELKNAGDENATLDGAFNQLQTYKAQISSKGAFEKRRLLALLKDFIVFGETGSGLAKILAGYHQFHAVRHAVAETVAATSPQGDRRIGVVWHTQGSGKSLLMSFYAGQVIKHPAMGNPTLVVLTDRNDLDDQLFNTFSLCKDLLRQTPQQAEDRDHLRKLLNRPSGGVIFTTIQKFQPKDGEIDFPPLTDRRNVVVIADEAHRSGEEKQRRKKARASTLCGRGSPLVQALCHGGGQRGAR